MPSEDASHQRGQKMPFVASEIFSQDITPMLLKFFEEPTKDEEPSNEEDDEATQETTKVSSNKDDSDDDVVVDKDKSSDDEDESKEKSEEEKDKEEKSDEKAENAEDDKKEEDSDKKDEDSKEEEAEKKEDEDKKEEASEDKKDEDKEDEKKEDEKKESTEDDSEKKEESTEDKKEDDKEESTEDKKEEAAEEKKEDESKEDGILDKKDEEESKEESTDAKEADKKEEEVVEEVNKYMLLDQLFMFIKNADKKPLNPVLSGYFQKLVSLLTNRKFNLMAPYVFSPDSTIIENLFDHIYQKSISEVLNKYILIMCKESEIKSNQSEEIFEQIKIKKEYAFNELINKLRPQWTDEDHLNASQIIVDNLEYKSFFSHICRRAGIQKLIDIAFAEPQEGQELPEFWQSSKDSALLVLIAVINKFSEKVKNGGKLGKFDRDEDDEDMTLKNDSDEDQDEVEQGIINSLVDVVKKIQDSLSSDPRNVRVGGTQYSSEDYVPLGRFRLRAIELFLILIKLHRQALYDAITDSEILAALFQLVHKYPWNNFLHLKFQYVWTEILTVSQNPEFRKACLIKSDIAKEFTSLADKSYYTHASERKNRAGHMHLVTHISNLLTKSDKEEVKAYLADQEEGWTKFVDGELKDSNTKNDKNLGDQQPRSSADDDNDDGNFEVNMENIMQRFQTFNQIMSTAGSSQNTDDDNDSDEEDSDNIIEKEIDDERKNEDGNEDDLEIKDLSGENDEEEKTSKVNEEDDIKEVEIKEIEPLK